MKRVFAYVFVWGVLTFIANGAYLKDYPVTLSQPDGSQIECFASGDEIYNFLHTKDGYVIIQEQDGYYYYAIKSQSNIIASNYRVSGNNPEELNLQKWIKPDQSVLNDRIKSFLTTKENSGKKSNNSILISKSGLVNNLVVFVRFSDQTEYTENYSKYDMMYNNDTGTSFKNFYLAASYNKMTVKTYLYPTSTTNVISIKDNNKRDYYRPYNATSNKTGYKDNYQKAIRKQELLTNVVNQLKNYVSQSVNFDSDNDGNIDNVTFIIKGNADSWNDLLWPHRSSLYGASKINGKNVLDYNLIVSDLINSTSTSYGLGVLCHEFFHSVGCPDLYHYSYDGYTPTGKWDLMELTANPPQYMCNYLKYQYTNWITTIPEINREGSYSLKPITSATNSIFRVKIPGQETEWINLEYRKREGNYDISIPGSGLLVYRINYARNKQGNAGGPPDEIYLFRPNGDVKKDGTVDNANFSTESNRYFVNDITEPKLFLTDGSPTGIEIYDISKCGDSISFKIGYTPRTYFTSPTNNKTDVEIKPTLSWKSYSKAKKYQIQLAKDTNFTTLEYDITDISDTNYSFTNKLDSYQKYYARVRWTDGSTTSPWSYALVFTTNLSAPEMIYPTDNCDSVSIISKFVWHKVNGAASYQLFISDTPDFNSTFLRKYGIKDTSYTLTKALTLNKKYYWKVSSTSVANTNVSSDVFTFTTKKNDIQIISTTESQAICPGKSVALQVSVAGSKRTYQWYKNNSIITNANDSVYSITGFSETDGADYQCIVTAEDKSSSVSSAVISLQLIKQIELEASNIGEHKVGDSLTVTVKIKNLIDNYANIYQYQWLKNGTQLKDDKNYSGTNKIALHIDSLSEEDLSSKFVLRIITKCGDTTFAAPIQIKLGVDESEIELTRVNLSPNPTDGVLNIEFNSNSSDKVDIILSDISGMSRTLLSSEAFESGNKIISIDLRYLNLSSGTYFIHLKINNNVYHAKMSYIR